MTRTTQQDRQCRKHHHAARHTRRSGPVLAAALEPRRLFATLVVNGGSGNDTCIFDVTGGFINASMNGFNIPQPVGLWDDVQINLFEGNDTVEIRNTGDEPVDISLGTGTDFVQITPTSDDLDSIVSRVRVLAGTDAADDDLEVFDIGDSGDDAYTVVEDGPMKLRKGSADKLFWGESNLRTSIFLNDGNNTVTIDSSVSMTGTDEQLLVGGQAPGFGGGNDTCNVNGIFGAANTFRFNGGTGSDVLNVTGSNFSGSDALIFMDGGNSTGDTLNITDSGAADTYLFAGNRDTIFLSTNTILAGEYRYIGTEAINLSATAVSADTFDIQELGADVSIDAGDGDDSFILGDNAIDSTDFGSAVDIIVDGGPGVDDVLIRDSLATTARTHTLGGDVYDHVNIGTLDMTSISDAVLNCGSGADTIDVNFNPGGGSQLTVNGNGGADAFEVTPDVTTAIQLNGGAPTTAPGDVLTLDVGTQTGGIFTPGGVGAGSYDFPVRDLISFTGMEGFPVAPAAPGAADLAAADDTGISSSDNITNDTSLNFSGTGAAASSEVELFRDGASIATATAAAGGAYSFANVAFPTGDDTFAMTVRYNDAASGLLSDASAALNVRVDTLVPVSLAPPNLATASDSGISNSDNITNVRTPGLDGSVTPNDIVRYFADGVLVGADTTTSGGTYSSATGTLADGTRIMTVRAEDLAGNQSPASPPLVIVVDTVAPTSPTTAPDLTAASDLGPSSTDNITRDNTPTLTGTAPGNHIVRLLAGGAEVGFVQLPLAVTTYNVTSSALADGNRVMTTRFEDIAGNASPGVSPPLTVQIDTVAPTLSASAAFNFLTSQNLTYQFSENVGQTLSVADLTLLNLTNTTTVPSGSIAVNYIPNTATFTFPGFANGTLPDADYRARMTGDDLTDVAGNQFVGVQFDFFFLNGDANRDRRVNLSDFNIMASNFGQSNRNFAQGDFTYDGTVNLQDFNLLASRFGRALGPAGVAPQTPGEVRDRLIDELV